MLVIKHNCGHGYKSTVMAPETAISIGTKIVMVHEPFIGSPEICHNRFNFYWPPRKRKEIRVITAVRKDLRDKIMVDHRTNA